MSEIIKAWVNGAVQEIEVEDIYVPEQPLSPEERLDDIEQEEIVTDSRLNTLEDKHNTVITAGNFLVGNGTTEPEEMTPEETLSHINGSSIAMVTTEEYEAIQNDGFNANTFYLISDGDENENFYDKTEIDGMVEEINTSISDAVSEVKSYSDANLESAEVYTDEAVAQKSQVQMINVSEDDVITEILSTLKIHKLSKEKYDEELANGNIDETALYLTPDEDVDLSGYATIEQLNEKSDEGHTHIIDDVAELRSTLDTINESISNVSKLSHTHSISDIVDLQETLDNNLEESKSYIDNAVAQMTTVQIITWGVDD